MVDARTALFRDILASLFTAHEGIESELRFGLDASLKLWRRDDPLDYVVVSASATGWFELAVGGRFGTFEVDEDASAAEATAILQRYVEAAIAYLEERWTWITTRVLRRPAIRIDSEDGPIQLNLTLNEAFRSLVNPRGGRKRRQDKRSPS